MKTFVWNSALAVLWAAATGRFTLANVAFGFALGYAVLYFVQPLTGRSPYFRKVPQLLRFLAFLLWEILKANFRVAHDVLTPRFHMRPGVIAVPLDAKTDAEITIFAALITLTPGSISLDVSDDRKVLYVHMMFIDDIALVRRRIKEGLERRLLELLR